LYFRAEVIFSSIRSGISITTGLIVSAAFNVRSASLETLSSLAAAAVVAAAAAVAAVVAAGVVAAGASSDRRDSGCFLQQSLPTKPKKFILILLNF